jgi:aspartyl protease family protein
MKKACFLIGCSLFLSALAFSSYADTLKLKNGRSIEGIIKKEDAGMVELEIGAGSVKFLKSEIAEILRSSGSEDSLLRSRWQNEKAVLEGKIARRDAEEASKPRKATFSHDSKGMTVAVRLNNKVDTTMVLDTGASLILLTRDVAEKLGYNLDRLRPNMKVQVADGRTVDAARIILDSVKVENSEAERVEASVLMEEKGNFGFEDGLLGMSFLKRFNFKIDLKEKKLILEKL